jgi:hypothetical protein
VFSARRGRHGQQTRAARTRSIFEPFVLFRVQLLRGASSAASLIALQNCHLSSMEKPAYAGQCRHKARTLKKFLLHNAKLANQVIE